MMAGTRSFPIFPQSRSQSPFFFSSSTGHACMAERIARQSSRSAPSPTVASRGAVSSCNELGLTNLATSSPPGAAVSDHVSSIILELRSKTRSEADTSASAVAVL